MNDLSGSDELAVNSISTNDEQKLNQLKIILRDLVDFLIRTFNEIGIDGIHDLTNPSLDDLANMLDNLNIKVKTLPDDNMNLGQTIWVAQMLLSDIKSKNKAMCENSKYMLERVQIFN